MAHALETRGRSGPALPASVALGICVALAGCNGGSGGGGAAGATAVNADIIAVSVTPNQAAVEAGVSVGVSIEIRNDGPDSVPSFRVAAHLSTDAVLDAGDPRLGTWTIAGLDPGETMTTGGVLQIPVATVAGPYRLIAFADDRAELAETKESNNTVASLEMLMVSEAQHPDLVVESVTYGPSAIQAGQTINVDDEVRNIGPEASGSFRVGFYLSADATIDATDLLIGQRQVLNLDPGAGEAGTGPLTVPSFVTAGSYFVGVLADDLNTIVEMDEGNNGLAANVTLAVSAAPLPDLAPTTISFSPGTVDAGDPIIVDEAVINQGLSVSPLFQVSIYLSTDPDIDPLTDTLLGTRAVPSLAVGSTSLSGASSLIIPGPTPAGEYFVGVFVDAAELVPETDEGNNSLIATGRVTITTPPLSDLVAQTFTFSPSSIQAGTGATITINDDVANLGQAPSGVVRVAIYISNDVVISTNDILLGFHELPALAIGSGTGRTIDLPVPGGITTGSYRVAVWVDDLDIEPELNEGNNLLVATGFLDVTESGVAAPNLVSEVVDPAQLVAAPGEAFQVVTRVANVGDASTTPFRVGVYLSTDATITTSDIRIGDRFVPFGLGAGFSSVANAPVTIPGGTLEGDYTLGLIADWQNVVAESDETDNVLVATGTFRVIVPPPPRPDLNVSAVDVISFGPFDPGDLVRIDHTVNNTGTVDAGAFRVGIYMSDDAVIETTDTLLGSRVISSLAISAESRNTITVQIPPGTAPGGWQFGVIADDLNAVEENDEGNNARVDPEIFVVQ